MSVITAYTTQARQGRPYRNYPGALARAGLVALLWLATPAQAAVAPALGNAQGFAVLGASAVTNTGASLVTGDLGITPGTGSSVTGFPPGLVNGTTHFADAVALAAATDTTTAYNNLAGQACNVTVAADLGGTTLVPGVYCSASSMGLTGTVTLDAQGDPNAVFVFKMGSTLTTASNATVNVINSGQSCNVFWQVGSSATLGSGTTFVGNILALASITLNTGASTNGRILARTGAVTLDGNAVSVCSLAAPPGPVVSPTLAKAFNLDTINAGGVSTLTITMSNPNATSATLTAALTDTLPGGVTIASPTNLATTCSGVGGPTAAAGGATVSLPAGYAIPANGSCTLSVNVTAPAGGSYINTLPIGSLITSNGNNAGPAVATLVVVPAVPGGPPTLGKAFSPAAIGAGGVSTLTITLSNPNAAIATLSAALTDTLPSGVVIAAPSNLATTCTGAGVPVATVGGSTVSLPAGQTIPANGSCTLSVNVTAANGGSFINTLLAGALATSNGNNAAPAAATLTVTPLVLIPPTLGKAFAADNINAGGVSTLTVTLSNPNATNAILTAALTDTLPGGVVIANPANPVTTCNGVGGPTAVAGGSTLSLPAGYAIPANGSCTMAANVTAAAGGSYINTLPIGALATNNGNNPGPAVATLVVVPAVLGGPPTLGKAFSPSSINAGGVSTLTITLSNPNVANATLTAALVDTLPSGVVIAAPANPVTTCTGVGAPVATVGGTTVSLPPGRIIPATGSCTLRVNVTAAIGGSYLNTLLAGALATSNGSNVSPAIATLTVVTPPGGTVTPPGGTPPGGLPPGGTVIPPVPNSIPTLSEWAMILLMTLMALTGFAAMRRPGR